MNKRKEDKICIWMHHIATVIGMLEGIWGLASEKKDTLSCTSRVFCLSLFTGSQLWAMLKILSDAVRGSSRMKDSILHIRALSGSASKGRRMLGAVTALSVLFKIGVPAALNHS